MSKNHCGITAADILKIAASHVDFTAKENELDDAGKMIIYRYDVRLLLDCLSHGMDIADADYMDSMSDYLDQQIAICHTAHVDTVIVACMMFHAYSALGQIKANEDFQGV